MIAKSLLGMVIAHSPIIEYLQKVSRIDLIEILMSLAAASIKYVLIYAKHLNAELISG